MNQVNILVKVGKKAKLRLNSTDCNIKRAISSSDIKGEYDLIIIENIDKEEVKDIKKILESIENKESIVFYLPEDEAITSGLADELDLNIYLDDKELYKFIYNKFELNLSPYLDFRKEIIDNKAKEFEEFDFENLIDVVENSTKYSNEEASCSCSEEIKNIVNLTRINKKNSKVIKTISNENNNLKSDIYELEKRESNLKLNIDTLKSQLENSKKTIKIKEDTIYDLKLREKELIEKLDILNEQIKSGEIHEEVLKEYTNKIKDIQSKYNQAIEREDKYLEKMELVNNELNDNSLRLIEESIERNYNLNKLIKVIDKIEELQSKLLDNNKEIELLKLEKDKISNRLDVIIKEKELIEKELHKNNENLTLRENELIALNIEIEKKLIHANSEIDKAYSIVKNSDNIIREKDIKINELENNLRKNIIESIKPIKYNKKAKIYTVIGSGSFGVTNTAMSIASRLSASDRVLLIDFDLVSPKADSWFMMNPMIKNITGIINNGRNSGLGIFYDYGYEKVVSNIDLICKCHSITKGGGLHYLSGLYNEVDSSVMVNADYSGLINGLSERFSYIVIDLGKIGNNKLNNSLIKELMSIADMNIAITNQNYFSIRNFKMKALSNNIDLSNCTWLINMCLTNLMDNNIKRQLDGIKYYVITKSNSLTDGEYLSNKIDTRNMFDAFFEGITR